MLRNKRHPRSQLLLQTEAVGPGGCREGPRCIPQARGLPLLITVTTRHMHLQQNTAQLQRN